MKLLMVTPYYWPSFIRGGPAVSLHGLNKAMVRKGVDVTVYTTNVDLDKDTPVNRQVNVEGVKVNYFSSTGIFDFIATLGWQFSLPLARALKRNLEAFDLVYIVTAWSYPVVIAAHYCRLYKKPYIFSPRGMLYPDMLRKKFWKKWPFYKIFLQQALRGARAIHYTSDDEAEKTHPFLNLDNPKIIAPNGIEISKFLSQDNPEKFRLRYPGLKDKKLILFLGRLNWKKGLDILIQAFGRLIREHSEARLIIAGPDESGYAKKIKAWISKCGDNLENYVLFTGLLSGEEKLAAYKASDIFVLPSYSENFGMTVAEALASGVAVIVSNKVGISGLIEKNRAGIVIDPKQDSLYNALELLLENSELSNELGKNGRKLAQDNYDIDKVADNMIAAFQQFLN